MTNPRSQTNWQTRESCPTCAVSAPSRSTPRRTTRACAPSRGSGWPWRGGMFPASAWPGARAAKSARYTSRCAIPTLRQFRSCPGLPLAQGSHRSWRVLRHHERSLRLGLAAHRRWRADAAIRPARRGRRARGHGRREPAPYSLDAICRRHGLPGKDDRAAGGGVKAAGFVKGSKNGPIQCTSGGCRRAVVGPYAESDARTIRSKLYEMLKPIVEREGRATPTGSRSICCRWCIEMRRRGIRIDQDAAEQAYDTFIGKRDAALTELSDQHGAAVGMAEIQGTQMAGKDLRRDTASAIRAPRRAIPRSRPANRDGWPNTSTGCRAGSRSRRNTMTQAKVYPRTHPRPHRRRANLRRDSAVTSRTKAARLVSLQLLKAAAATNAEARR